MNKKELFYDEINYIKEDDLKKSACLLVEMLPDYFFEVAASSAGKYHPTYALGEGGLLRHTKAACFIAHELLNDPLIGEKYNDHEKDLMIIALLMHDGFKLGYQKEEYTRFDHPLLAGEFILKHQKEALLKESDAIFLNEVISSHMGPWTKDYQDNEVLPRPKNKFQNFVHMCDYLASRKQLLVSFDQNNNIKR